MATADAMKDDGKGKKGKKPRPEYLMVLTPECKITTEGFDEQADREWVVENVAFHLTTESGMSISMELKR